VNAIAVAFDGSNVCMMSKSIKESRDGSSVRKDLVPFIKFAVSGDNDGAAFIPLVDDFI
jgi:hypothetical protein